MTWNDIDPSSGRVQHTAKHMSMCFADLVTLASKVQLLKAWTVHAPAQLRLSPAHSQTFQHPTGEALSFALVRAPARARLRALRAPASAKRLLRRSHSLAWTLGMEIWPPKSSGGFKLPGQMLCSASSQATVMVSSGCLIWLRTTGRLDRGVSLPPS